MQSLTAIDDFIAYQAGRHIIKLTWTNHGVYNVTVHDGVHQLDDLGGPVATEADARAIARGYAQMFNAEYAAKQQAPATLDTFRQAHRPVRNTRTRAHLKPPTAPMLRLMRQHTGGLVTTDGRASWLVLRTIAEKGFGEAIYRSGTYIVDAVRLNAAGLALVESEVKAA